MNELRDILQALDVERNRRNWFEAIQLYRFALQQVDIAAQPQLWAFLQSALGGCLLVSTEGDRAQNVEEAIAAFQDALRFRTRWDTPREWAITIHNLGRAYRMRLQGDPEDNLEKAIACYNEELKVITPFAQPAQWAETMYFLGNAYYLRQRGNRDESLAEAIHCYERALEVTKPETAPKDWATMAHDLAIVYAEWNGGNKAENIDIAIRYYQAALTLWKKLSIPSEWASTQHALGIAYHLRPQGDRIENLDRAIGAFHSASQVRYSQKDYGRWEQSMSMLAEAYHDLGNAYRARDNGERGENLEKAIEAYEQALQCWPRKFVEWAATQNALGIAYDLRKRGDRKENIEHAIEAYSLALTVRTREERPRQWAATQYNIGKAYFERIKGDRAENLEDAITVLQHAADVYKSEGMHSEWADIMNQLGIVYNKINKGDRTENLERKIEAHKESLRYWSRDETPDKWATAMHNLAIAYRNRTLGNRAANVEESIRCCLAALSVTSPQTKPIEWAETMTVLASAYLKRMLGDRAENIELALHALNQAMVKLPRQTEPGRWAMVMNNLADAYTERLRGERATNLRQAMTAYQQALEVMTRQARPVEWAGLMHNLGGAYMKLADEMQAPEERAVYLEQAVRALEDALTISTMEATPREHRETQYRLGNLYFTNQRWAEAYTAYDAALKAGEVAYRASATREARQGELQRVGFMPIRAAYCLAKTKRYVEAVERLEQGLARSLAESLALDEAALQHATPEDQAAFTAARERIDKLDAEARAVSQPWARNFLDVSAEMHTARQELEAIVERIRTYVPRLMPAQLDFNGIADIADELGQPLVYLLATLHGSLALIVPPGVKTLDAEHALWLDGLRTDYLKNMLSDRDATTWGYLHCVAGDGTEREIEILKRILDETLPILEANVMAPIVQYLTAHGYYQAILIPTDPFGLLPLPALIDETLALSVAPSANALEGAQRAARERASRDSTLLAVGNPLPNPKPLPYARIEVEEIVRLFDPGARRPPLFETDASLKNLREALPGTTHLHLSCHGSFNVARPLESALYLSGDDRLTLRQLLDGGLDLSAVKLVVLSACQTALTDFQTVPDEAIGFPAGFFETGVPGVIGTLWPVDDRATAILMFKFYENVVLDRQPPARALRHAQIWLRDATGHKLALMAHQMLDRSTREAEPPGFRRWAERQMQPERRDAKPYNHPAYWSAFYHVGV